MSAANFTKKYVWYFSWKHSICHKIMLWFFFGPPLQIVICLPQVSFLCSLPDQTHWGIVKNVLCFCLHPTNLSKVGRLFGIDHSWMLNLKNICWDYLFKNLSLSCHCYLLPIRFYYIFMLMMKSVKSINYVQVSGNCALTATWIVSPWSLVWCLW